MNSEVIIKEFKDQIYYRIDQSTRMIRLSLNQIEEEQIWTRPNNSSNSIGNLMLHLCGNITQYAIASLGNQEDNRQRDEEFAALSGLSKMELIDRLNKVVDEAKKVIEACDEHELMRKRQVQGFEFTGMGNVIHVTEHYSYHTGQIAFWVKQLVDKQSLGFYDNVNLNIKNKG